MSKSKFDTLQKAIAFIVPALCILYIGADLFIIFSRIFYPYQLEWMEGAGLVQVQRLLMGQALYTRPSVDYVPLIYPPLSYYLAMLVAKVIGFGFGAMRIVSFASSVICAVIIFLMVREKTNSKSAGLLGAGIFASAFILTNQWFDIARPDMLVAAFSMLGLYLARERESEKVAAYDVLAGLMFALAFLSKQSGLIIGLAAIAYYLIFNWKRCVRITLSFGIFTGVIYGIFWLTSGGWLNYYFFTIPAAHVFYFSIGRVLSVLIDQFAPIPIFFIAAILPAILSPLKIIQDKSYRYYFTMATALIVTGVIGRLNAFSGHNVYVPSYIGIAFLAGTESSWLMEIAQKTNNKKNGLILTTMQALLLTAQFGFIIPFYLTTKTIPTQADLDAGNSLVAKIRNYHGNVLLLNNNYLAIYAGKTPYYNQMPMSEISGQGNLYPMPEWPQIQNEIYQLIHSTRISALIVDSPDSVNGFINGCEQRSIYYMDKTVFVPVAGAKSRPEIIITCK